MKCFHCDKDIEQILFGVYMDDDRNNVCPATGGLFGHVPLVKLYSTDEVAEAKEALLDAIEKTR